MRCNRCPDEAAKRVLNLSRRSRRVLLDENLCDKHVQAELELATSGLSMTDIDIKPLKES